MSESFPVGRKIRRLALVGLCLGGVLAMSAPASALPFELGLGASLREIAGWFEGIKSLPWGGDPNPPNSGTCIDPNGKPRPCDSRQAPSPASRRELTRSFPAV